MEIPVIVERVRVFNGGWALISANLNPYSEKYSSQLEDLVSPHVNKKYNNFTITATLSDDVENMENGQYMFIGEFSNHPKFGPQFKSDFYYQDVPVTESGLITFLMTLPNIKEVRSQNIVKKFGVEGTFDILDNDIYRLAEISGITEQRIPAIEKEWKDKKHMRELYEFFISNGLTVRLADLSYKQWGKDAKEIILKNPYKLTDLRGVGFVMADKEAHKIMDKIPVDFRTTACIKYVLEEFVNRNGNLCIPYAVLKRNVLSVIHKCDEELMNDFNSKKILESIPKSLKKNLSVFSVIKDLEDNNIYVYLKTVWEKEIYIAQKVFERSKYKMSKKESEKISDIEVLLGKILEE